VIIPKFLLQPKKKKRKVKHSRLEKATAAMSTFAIVIFILKLTYYDNNKLGMLSKTLIGLSMLSVFLAFCFSKQLRLRFVDRWIRIMVMLPIILIIGLFVAFTIYFFQVIFQNGGVDPGSVE
jgi:glucan phosphoethanolaminetransferase (alkaline phosphatase superfamily)